MVNKSKINMMFKSMKTGVLAAILISAAFIANAQKKVTEGTITYKMDYTLTADQAGMEAQLPTESKVKFSGQMSKIEMEQGPATITVISDFFIIGIAINILRHTCLFNYFFPVFIS